MIEVGTVVRLKSGGPPMTVCSMEKFRGRKVFNCEWFDLILKLRAARFFEAELVEEDVE